MGNQIPPRVGMKLYGFCGGIFGRDHYGTGRIEVASYDYIVMRDDNEEPRFACVENGERMLLDENWLNPDNQDGDNGEEGPDGTSFYDI